MADAQVHQPPDVSQQIEALRQAGAHHFDPVRLHHIEQLAQRASRHQGRVKHLLDGKLTQALAVLGERLTHAQSAAKDAIATAALRYPQAVADLQQLFQAGDFKGVAQRIASLQPHATYTSLGDLARDLVQHSQEPVDGGFDGNTGLRAELKTTRDFRNTWSKLSVDKRVTKALEQAPKNAGPINSHLLVLRSLALMRDISPDYLNRFTSYVDTLLSLDQTLTDKPATAKKVAATDPVKPVKARRSRTR